MCILKLLNVSEAQISQLKEYIVSSQKSFEVLMYHSVDEQSKTEQIFPFCK